MNIEITENEFRKIIAALDNEINKLESIYNDINNKAQKLDGNDEMWHGNTQVAVYEYYESISKDFPDTVDRIKSFRDYLQTTLDNYINAEKSIDKDVDTNQENLNIN